MPSPVIKSYLCEPVKNQVKTSPELAYCGYIWGDTGGEFFNDRN